MSENEKDVGRICFWAGMFLGLVIGFICGISTVEAAEIPTTVNVSVTSEVACNPYNCPPPGRITPEAAATSTSTDQSLWQRMVSWVQEFFHIREVI
jgi:hypothetical protein